MRQRAALPILLALIAILPFLPALSGAFLYWDDRAFLFDNIRWRGFSAANVRWMLTTTYCGPYQPLAWLSYALTYSTWGLSSRAFHSISLLLHATTTGLFFLLMRELLDRGAPRAAERERVLAAVFATLAWAVHPLRVESVVWIAEQRDVLCALFYTLTVLLYIRRPGRNPSALAAFGLALLSKSSAITLPFTLLILDVWPLDRLKGGAHRALQEKIPFFAVAAVFAVMTFAGHAVDGALMSLAPDPLTLRAAIALHGPGFYLLKIICPVRLSPFYSVPPGFGLASPWVATYVTVAALAAACAWTCRRRLPAVTASLAHFFIALVPMAGLIRVGSHLAADRYTMVASMGPAALAGAALLAARRRMPRAALAAALLAVAALASATWNDARSWKDDVTLWTRGVAYDASSLHSQLNLSAALRRAGRPEEAAVHEEAAARLDPKLAGPWNNLADLALSQGRPAEAERLSRRAATLEPRLAAPHYNLGLALLKQGSAREAAGELRWAAAANPGWAAAQYSLGNALTVLGSHGEAAAAFDEAARLDPTLEEAWVNGGNAWARLGDYERAVRHYERALTLTPNDTAARANLAAVRGAARR